MGEIRFVGTGETHGYPYLVCKKMRVDGIRVNMKYDKRYHTIIGAPITGCPVYIMPGI